MKTITFYSYKGGVGRTLALANVAIYLSRFGQNVCIMDFDLEAPGLHYKFPKLVETKAITRGVVDYLHSYSVGHIPANRLTEFSVLLLPHTQSQGSVRLIPAGNVLSSAYWKKLAALDWHSMFYAPDGEGVPFFLDFKERIREDLHPDFLLIDSRTGITEMSGVCTSLLPDKVVFLIVNNQENIEGARQILRGIGQADRMPGQNPIEVTFALTRIPFPKDQREADVEAGIVKRIRDFLNEPAEDLTRQLEIADICILHSDRELELSESLRMGQERVVKETPLLRDYLRLFSKVIPEDVIVPKLDSVLDEITTSPQLLENPDKSQRQLEELVASYPHPKTLGRLIDFYVLRNEDSQKILGAFHQLWHTFRIEDETILRKYIRLFMVADPKQAVWHEEHPFNLEIIEKYLQLDAADKEEVQLRLAETYRTYRDLGRALRHYLELLRTSEKTVKILGEILGIYRKRESYEDALKMIERYPDVVDQHMGLRVQKADILFHSGNMDELADLLEDSATESALMDEDPDLYLQVMDGLGHMERVRGRLDTLLDKALKAGRSRRRLASIGQLFYRLRMRDQFKAKVSHFPYASPVIRDLDRRFRENSSDF